MATTWLSDIKLPKPFPSLQKNISTDVAIIGGGITGITSAYLLSKTGKKIIVLDKGSLDQSATAYTTAFLTFQIDTGMNEMVKFMDRKKAAQIWESHNEAIDLIEKIVKDEKIDCDFMRCPEYLYANDDKEMEGLHEEQAAAKKAGFSLEIHKKKDLPFNNAGYVTVPHQAKFHPLKYLLALKEIVRKNGVEIYEQTEVTKIHDNDPVILETDSAVVKAGKVLIATYDPFNHPLELFAHKGMYSSFVFEIELPKDTLPEALYLDQKNPYHYFRIDKMKTHDRMIIGGEDHRHELPMNEEKNYTSLEEHLKHILPNIKYKIVRKWEGPILEPSDGFAYIGTYSKKHDNYFVAMAFSGNGMTYSHITAMMFRDFVMGKKNMWEELYDPKRIPSIKQLLDKGVDYTGEFFGGAVKNTFQKSK